MQSILNYAHQLLTLWKSEKCSYCSHLVGYLLSQHLCLSLLGYSLAFLNTKVCMHACVVFYSFKFPLSCGLKNRPKRVIGLVFNQISKVVKQISKWVSRVIPTSFRKLRWSKKYLWRQSPEKNPSYTYLKTIYYSIRPYNGTFTSTWYLIPTGDGNYCFSCSF